MIEPWTFIEQPDEPTIEVKKSAWTNGHEKNCNFLQYLIYSNASDQIEHHTNAKKVWNILNLFSSLVVLVFSIMHFGN